MVFSSYPFILFFFPIVILVALIIGRTYKEGLIIFLSFASIVFYAYWDWHFVWVILLSIVVNYYIAFFIEKNRNSTKVKTILTIGVVVNLGLLGYFKYTNFFIDNINLVFNGSLTFYEIVLPLGISFFTFQQIAYLVDVSRNDAVEHNFWHYLLFVTFFPQLIAGPIVHHKEMMPQFVEGQAGLVSAPMFAQGLSIFVIGVAKKVLIADSIAEYATPVFQASANGIPIPFLEAWVGALSYTFQIYFDFSAYSDMAIGIGLMLGVKLPINFFSPYKASSIIDFWRRWHITLSRFLRDYIYIPLGGNKRGMPRRFMNLIAVMFLGGLWHGANWTFVMWGTLHGFALILNHFWNWLRKPYGDEGSSLSKWSGRVIVFLFLVVTWVFFRAESIGDAMNILSGMIGLNGVVLPETYYERLGSISMALENMGVRFESGYLFLGVNQVVILLFLLLIVWYLPNTIEWSKYEHSGKFEKTSYLANVLWEPTVLWSFSLSILMLVSLVYMSRAGEFLYFQF